MRHADLSGMRRHSQNWRTKAIQQQSVHAHRNLLAKSIPGLSGKCVVGRQRERLNAHLNAAADVRASAECPTSEATERSPDVAARRCLYYPRGIDSGTGAAEP